MLGYKFMEINIDGGKMTENQAQAASQDSMGDQKLSAGNTKEPVANPKKKKASWTRTILWMLSMVLLVNVFFAIVAYVLHRMQII